MGHDSLNLTSNRSNEDDFCDDFEKHKTLAKIVSVGTGNPSTAYSQIDVLKKLGIKNHRIAQVFENSHIETRSLCLPENDMEEENQDVLLEKHLSKALIIGEEAILRAINKIGIAVNEIDYFCAITSTGFLCPGLTAHFLQKMGFRDDCQRCDIVGMGCNAGLNGLNVVSNWATKNEGGYALMLCVEICSAIYVNDNTINSAVVNSLFGDGAAAIIVTTEKQKSSGIFPAVLGFNGSILKDTVDIMKYVWDKKENKFSFLLDRDVPYAIGRNIEKPVNGLLLKFGLHKRDISHWLVHSGGRKVIDAIKYNLGLTGYDVRHATNILKQYGNMSSGSFLFSYNELVKEDVVQKNQFGLIITMGPGVQIETGLLRWVT